uniref:Uncharacterized protein n=1 Tax=Caenorhabditis japonica TaxID=281687 RepID=A0A8R1ISC0_CAEJA
MSRVRVLSTAFSCKKASADAHRQVKGFKSISDPKRIAIEADDEAEKVCGSGEYGEKKNKKEKKKKKTSLFWKNMKKKNEKMPFTCDYVTITTEEDR